jgi:phosphomethylpyrimidine synthase
MRITQEVRDFARSRNLEDEEAIEAGMREKAEEFRERGGEVYTKS